MTLKEFEDLVAALTDTEKLKVLRLLEIAVSRPDVRSAIKDCHERGLDLDATIAELTRRLWTN
jgi:hypothetical protein